MGCGLRIARVPLQWAAFLIALMRTPSPEEEPHILSIGRDTDYRRLVSSVRRTLRARVNGLQGPAPLSGDLLITIKRRSTRFPPQSGAMEYMPMLESGLQTSRPLAAGTIASRGLVRKEFRHDDTA
ncbi:uncharacterized protein BP5553_08166 [Venustampulla echinocandica]|uniref:Uncharacterized protein n=1 Tax=Venustampulla echinocandica TaxID=2656787 RepID=A0A370TFX2_9HELO|nr:uncharacterized protein BP5553_08166 [Venustampulla echinocandica]RDL33798.1 hypothetical protein BP5553_08166 [Venustampulla echinocandica]